MKSDDGSCVGNDLDRFRWDYEPKTSEQRFFLKPLSAVFGAFQWEGKEGRFPVPEERPETPQTADD